MSQPPFSLFQHLKAVSDFRWLSVSENPKPKWRNFRVMSPLLFFLVGHALAVRHRSFGDECDQELAKVEGLLAKWCKRHIIVSSVDCESDARWTMQQGSHFRWQVYLGNQGIKTKTPVLSAGFNDQSDLASLKDLKHFVTKMNGALSTDSDWFELAKAAQTHAFLCHPCFTHFVAGIAISCKIS